MDPIHFTISRPVTIAVSVILVVLFGLIGATSIPIQLTPTVDQPIITVTTSWPGRSPEEIVEEITKEQEERLKNIKGLESMRSISREGTAEITLQLYVGSDTARALQEVADALRRVPEYPEEVDEPTVKAAEGASENAIAWFILDVDPAAQVTGLDVRTLGDVVERQLKPWLERVDGVAEINVFGGTPREARVLVDLEALARRDLDHNQLIDALRAENRNVSAGSISEGKRDYRVRLVGQYHSPSAVLETIVAYREGKPVRVADVATVEIGYARARGFVRAFGQPCLAINCIRQSNANVVKVMSDLRERIVSARAEILPILHPEHGKNLRLRQVYDETVYIDSAIDLVTSNLYVGGALAALVLLVFLRSVRATLIISVAIPISVIGTFLVLLALGRTLNVISLGGLAFAVGMVVDNAIVVLENIDRHLKMGKTPFDAAYHGTREVWGAILAATLTTVAVFVPVLTLGDESGQLFRDISLAVVASVSLSLVVAMMVIPTTAARLLRTPEPRTGSRGLVAGLFGLTRIGSGISATLAAALRVICRGKAGAIVRPGLALVMAIASIYFSLRWMPPLDYLPPGNRNLVFGGLLIPPGYSLEQQTSIAERIEAQILPYAQADSSRPETLAALPKIPNFGSPTPFEPVGVDSFFIGSFGGGLFVGATSQEPQVVIPVGSLLTVAMNTIPDAFGGARQTSIFGRGVGGGNSINLEISGPILERVVRAAAMMNQLSGPLFGYGNVRPSPANFNLLQPEWQLELNQHGRELGLSNRALAATVRGFFDGAFAGDYIHNGENIDLVVLPAGGRLVYKELLAEIPIMTPGGHVVPVDSVLDLKSGLAPQEIQRIEELPSVTVQIVPPAGEALEATMTRIQTEVIAAARDAGLLDSTMRVRLEGTAAKLDQVRDALLGAHRPPDERQSKLSWRIAGATLVAALIALVVVGWRRRGQPRVVYGALGTATLVLLGGALVAGLVASPELLQARFAWALIVTYLLLASLYESFIYPIVIMLTVPLALAGGFAGLRIVHDHSLSVPTIAPQQLDVLTMLGFVILVGVVVNNAILIVHQALNFLATGEHTDPIDAVAESTRTRVRPILMSTLTSVLGMLPLVLMPGAGSEMYRGLGSVVVGGLIVSTVFTLVLVPLLLTLVFDAELGVGRKLGETWTPVVG